MTTGAAGRPSVRTVLVKTLDERGIVFFTNYESAKAADLEATHYAAAVFAWLALERQVRLSGPVEQVSRAETEAYFASRPRGSRSHSTARIAWCASFGRPVPRRPTPIARIS